MRKGANLAISQWFQQTSTPNQWQRAACVNHQYLPWTHDTTPCARDIAAMKAVCDQCPLLRQCANYALRTHLGGFYAGTWIPWSGPSETDITKLNRHRSRRHLRELVGARR